MMTAFNSVQLLPDAVRREASRFLREELP